MNDQQPTPATPEPNQGTAAAATEASSAEHPSASHPVMQHCLEARCLILLYTCQDSLSDPDVLKRCNAALTTSDLILDISTDTDEFHIYMKPTLLTYEYWSQVMAKAQEDLSPNHPDERTDVHPDDSSGDAASDTTPASTDKE